MSDTEKSVSTEKKEQLQLQPPRPGFKVMTDQDINEYMTGLGRSDGGKFEGSEATAEAELRLVAEKRNQIFQQIQNVEVQLENMKKEAERVTGEMDAFGLILQRAEDERRFNRIQEIKITKIKKEE